jgi:hypothetical protein
MKGCNPGALQRNDTHVAQPSAVALSLIAWSRPPALPLPVITLQVSQDHVLRTFHIAVIGALTKSLMPSRYA